MMLRSWSGLGLCVCAAVIVTGRAVAAEESAAPPGADAEIVFADDFRGPELEKGWRRLREHEGYWRLREGGLEIRAEPGLAETVRNALVRPLPGRERSKLIVEVAVSNLVPPTEQYEQGGITLYNDGKPVFKLVKERIDGGLYIIPGRVPLEGNRVTLRLVLTADRFTAQFRPEGEKEFRTAAEGPLPAPKSDEISIQCYHGPTDAEHWIRFEGFRILRAAP
ncbi:MAG: DUF1349 domain-containing protein [Thermogutta sp.]|nr:DUF1349 domain-containing protein [Thermogutta sp.]